MEILNRCESHAEREFVLGLVDWCRSVGGKSHGRPDGSLHLVTREDDGVGPLPDSYMVSPQRAVGRYRLDFEIHAHVWPADGRFVYAVEIDGHEWHERTHAQAAAQRRRDRDLAREGIFTIRFAAIEVLDDRLEVARELIDMITDLESAGSEHFDHIQSMNEWIEERYAAREDQ